MHLPTGCKVAVKIYEKSKLNNSINTKRCVQREIKILNSIMSCYKREASEEFGIVGHPNIMKLYDAIETERELCLILELCQGKMLSTIMKDKSSMITRQNLAEDVSSIIFS